MKTLFNKKDSPFYKEPKHGNLIAFVVFLLALSATVIFGSSIGESSQIDSYKEAKAVTEAARYEDYNDKLIKDGFDEVGSNGKKAYVLEYMGKFSIPSSYLFNRDVNRLLAKVKPGDAVVVHVESLGGASQACANDYHAVTKLKDAGVEVYTVSDYFALSCGYKLLSSGTKAYSSPGALVGNIGSVQIFNGASKALVIGSTRLKELYAGAAPQTEEDRSMLRQGVIDSANHFKDLVLKARGDRIKESDYERAFSASPFNADEALSLGLVDELKDSWSVLLDLHKQGYDIKVVK